MNNEEPLEGGSASGSVVRIGDTVRKPWSASTASVVAFVDALRSLGVDAPAPMGRDEHGRQVQEFVPGTLAINADPLSRADLHRVGGMVRAIHDASTTYVPPDDAVWETAIPAPASELVCHNDLAPWNLLVGDRWMFIDAAAPSTRLWDLAYSAQAFTLSDPSQDPSLAADDLSAFVDGYQPDDHMRRLLPDTMAERTAAMYNMLRASHDAGKEPWASMFTAGHGDHWSSADNYVRTHRNTWLEAL